MTTEHAIQDVAMIARNGIDRIIALERDKATQGTPSSPPAPLKTGVGLLEQRGMQIEITLLPGTLDA